MFKKGAFLQFLPKKPALLQIFVSFRAFSRVLSAGLCIRFTGSHACYVKSYAFANKFAHLIRKIRQFSSMGRKFAFDSENSQQPTELFVQSTKIFLAKFPTGWQNDSIQHVRTLRRS
jgi:hypothetical protein